MPYDRRESEDLATYLERVTAERDELRTALRGILIDVETLPTQYAGKIRHRIARALRTTEATAVKP